MRVRLLAEVLRSMAQTDPLVSKAINPINKNGEVAYRTVVERLAAGEISDRARRMTSFDLDFWFER